MDARVENQQPQKVETSYTYQFIHKLQQLILFAIPLTKNQNFLGRTDGLETVRNKLAQLDQSVRALSAVIVVEEDNRPAYSLPGELLQEIEEAKEELGSAQTNLKKIKERGEKKATKLELLESQISNDIEIQNSQISADIIEQKAKVDERRNQLNDQKSDLKFKQGKLETKIDSACCGCGTKKYIKEKEVVDADIKNIDEQLTQLALDADKITGKSRRSELKEKLQRARAALDKHREQFPKKLEEARQRVELAEIEFEAKNVKVDKEKQHYAAAVSNQAMLFLLKSYLCFDAFNQACDAEFIKNLADTAKRKVNMKKLSDEMTAVKAILHRLLDVLWCPDSANRTGMMILSSFDQTAVADILCYASSNQDAIDKFIPSDQKTSETKKKKRLSAVINSIFSPGADTNPGADEIKIEKTQLSHGGA